MRRWGAIGVVAAVVMVDVLSLWPRCHSWTFPDAPPERDRTSYPIQAVLVTVLALFVGAGAPRMWSQPDP